MNHSENTDKIFGAVSAMQAEMLGAAKTAENPFFHSSYADLAEVWSAIKSPLAKNGLCVIQTFKQSEAGVVIVTTLGHSSGQWISGELFLKPVKSDPQAYGSAITYGRRYALAAVCGVYQVDDDAQDASHQVHIPSPVIPKAQTPASTSSKWDHQAAKTTPVYNGSPFGRVLKACDQAGWDKKFAGKLSQEKFGEWQFSKLLPSQVDWLCNTISTLTVDDAFEALRIETKDALRTNPPSAMFDENNPPEITEENLPF